MFVGEVAGASERSEGASLSHKRDGSNGFDSMEGALHIEAPPAVSQAHVAARRLTHITCFRQQSEL